MALGTSLEVDISGGPTETQAIRQLFDILPHRFSNLSRVEVSGIGKGEVIRNSSNLQEALVRMVEHLPALRCFRIHTVHLSEALALALSKCTGLEEVEVTGRSLPPLPTSFLRQEAD